MSVLLIVCFVKHPIFCYRYFVIGIPLFIDYSDYNKYAKWEYYNLNSQ